jgi:peptide deformylase
MPKELKIVQKGNPTLRLIAKEIPAKDICSEKIKNIIEQMRDFLNAQKDGVALAAPQIGISLQIFIVSKKVEIIMRENDNLSQEDFLSLEDTVYINPKIKKLSRDKTLLDEGCLSVPNLYGQVKRSSKVIICAYNEKGDKITRGASGLLAQIFQHEIDHLNGILFIDKAKDIRKITPEQIK